MILPKTDAIFTFNGEDMILPADTFIIYRKGRPQYYRCLPNHTFGNDWINFDCENNKEEKMFLAHGLQYEQPVKLSNLNMIRFCIKAISLESLSYNIHRNNSIKCYMQLIFNKVSEYISPGKKPDTDDNFAKLSTVRNKIYKGNSGNISGLRHWNTEIKKPCNFFTGLFVYII